MTFQDPCLVCNPERGLPNQPLLLYPILCFAFLGSTQNPSLKHVLASCWYLLARSCSSLPLSSLNTISTSFCYHLLLDYGCVNRERSREVFWKDTCGLGKQRPLQHLWAQGRRSARFQQWRWVTSSSRESSGKPGNSWFLKICHSLYQGPISSQSESCLDKADLLQLRTQPFLYLCYLHNKVLVLALCLLCFWLQEMSIF